jgi:hypothetical protein
MADPSPQQHATRGEIVELAAAEGHDADIPTNIGSLHSVPSHTSTRPYTPGGGEKDMAAAMEKDIERGPEAGSTSSTYEPKEAVSNPNIVDFDGPDNMENPMNWRASKKWGMVMLVSAITFLTPLASSIFAPGIPEVMREFNSTNDMLEGFMLSIYVLGVSLCRIVLRFHANRRIVCFWAFA